MSLQASDGVAWAELNRVAATVVALLPGKETNQRLPRPPNGTLAKSPNRLKATSSK
jgi:hypothetical protein